MDDANPESVFRRVRRWLHGQVVKEVPEDIAVCEFDCRKGQCRMGEWSTCERRHRIQQAIRDDRVKR